MSQWERSVLLLGSQVPCAYPAMCWIQREAKKNIFDFCDKYFLPTPYLCKYS